MTEVARPTRAIPWATIALVGIILYIATDIVLAFLRPDYSLLTNPESDYGRGRYCWLMDVNFVIRGLFSVAAIVALLRTGIATRWTATFLAIWAVASALLAAFPDNPVGYPHLTSGPVHLLLAAIAFLAIAVATLWMSLRARKAGSRPGVAAAQLVLSVIGVITLLALLHPFGIPGLVERIFLAAEIGWLAVTLIAVRSSNQVTRAGVRV